MLKTLGGRNTSGNLLNLAVEFPNSCIHCLQVLPQAMQETPEPGRQPIHGIFQPVGNTCCGHSFSASAISTINKGLDQTLARFAQRQLDEPYPYLILDARYERVREAGVIAHRAVLVAIGINWDGQRQVLAVELANRESQSSWKEFLLRLKERGLAGVEFVVSDDHAGLKKAIREVLTEGAWQRCYVHFLRNALDYLPRKADDDCLQELRWLYDRHDIQEAQRDWWPYASWQFAWEPPSHIRTPGPESGWF